MRRGIAQGVGKIAQHLMVPPMHPDGSIAGNAPGWPECLEFMANCASSQDENHRELSFITLSNLVPLMIDFMPETFPTIKAMVLSGLQDASSIKVIC